MKSLLLVEDDLSLGATLAERLEKVPYQVAWAKNLEQARAQVSAHNFDLLVIDLSLPDGSGFELARHLQATKSAPFIFMTALNSAENRLEGYEMGAHEFIPKPFHLKELLLRVAHALGTHFELHRITCGETVIDLDAMSFVKPDGIEVRPLVRDFQLLKFLVERSPRVVSRDEILENVWGEDRYPSTRTIDNSIVRLRQDLSDRQSQWIRSVRGIGYQWAGPRS